MKKLQMKIFGRLTDIFATSEYTLHTQANTVGELRQALEETFPALRGGTYFIVVANHKASDEQVINERDNIALLPPYSGG